MYPIIKMRESSQMRESPLLGRMILPMLLKGDNLITLFSRHGRNVAKEFNFQNSHSCFQKSLIFKPLGMSFFFHLVLRSQMNLRAALKQMNMKFGIRHKEIFNWSGRKLPISGLQSGQKRKLLTYLS